MDANGLPNEIVTLILEMCDYKTVVFARMVSRRFSSIIDKMASLQWKIESHIAGLDVSQARNSAHDSLQIVKRRQDAWTNLSFTAEDPFPYRPPAATSGDSVTRWKVSYSNGLICHYIPEMGLQIRSLPSSLYGVTERVWTLPFEQAPDAIAMDRQQNLLIVVKVSPTAFNELDVHVMDLSSGSLHPDAKNAVLTFSPPHNNLRIDAASVQIVGDTVAILATSDAGYLSSLRIFNWKMGQPQCELRLPFGTDSFVLLSAHHFVLPILRYRISAASAGLQVDLHIFIVHSPTVSISVLELPFLPFPLARTWTMFRPRIICDPVPGSICIPQANSNDLIPTYADRLFAFPLPYEEGKGFHTLYFTLAAFTEHIDLQDSTTSNHVIVPWEKWGPKNSQIVMQRDVRSRRMPFIQGLRAIWLLDDIAPKQSLSYEILDFNQVSIRRDVCLGRNLRDLVREEVREGPFVVVHGGGPQLAYRRVESRLPSLASHIMLGDESIIFGNWHARPEQEILVLHIYNLE